MKTEDFHRDEPEWGPLESIVPLEECGRFMYMGWLEVDGLRLHHYKHSITRRYLFVTDSLETYRYDGDSLYGPLARKQAIRHVFNELRQREPRTGAKASHPQTADGMLAYHETDNGQASR